MMTALAQNPNPIVTVQVSTVLAPTPPDYQQSGCMVTFGGTSLQAGEVATLTQYEDLEDYIVPSLAVETATWATNVATITFVENLSQALQDTTSPVAMIFTGFTPSVWNGTFECTVTGPDTVTFPLLTDPAAATVMGSMQLLASNTLNAQAATFYSQGTKIPVDILELGPQGSSIQDEISTFETWLTANPLTYYGYLMPGDWGLPVNIPDELELFNQFVNPEAMTYFWLTLTPQAVGLIPPTCKSVVQLVEAPGVSSQRQVTPGNTYNEFTIAGMFYWAMQYKATSITPISPMCFKYIYGVTPFPTGGTVTINGQPMTYAAFLQMCKAKFVNYIQAGAEGGVAFTDVYQGVTADGFDYFNWWWTIDWVQINANIDLSNAIINGSNNPLAPLIYNQPGINRLQAVLAARMKIGITFGMVTGIVVQTAYNTQALSQAIALGVFTNRCDVNAIPFAAYAVANPSHYGIGEYDGLSTLFIPARGFVHILVQVVATDIVTV